MADEVRKSYPYVPGKHWWDLRRRFQQAVPGKVDSNYLQTVLDIGEGHAKNLVPQLRVVGLIDEVGKPTPLANEWRDDETYAAACEKILKAVYPRELMDALPPPKPDQGTTERWFARTLGIGQSAATKMASFYRLIASGDVAGATAVRRTSEPKESGKRTEPKRTPAAPVVAASNVIKEAKTTTPKQGDGTPSLHIDVQVHIPPDATAEQIDTIFAAMAKHIYKR